MSFVKAFFNYFQIVAVINVFRYFNIFFFTNFAPSLYPHQMTCEIHTQFSAIIPPQSMAKSMTPWHFKAYVLWNLLPTRVTADGVGWLLGQSRSAIERLVDRFEWKSRREMRKETKEEAKKAKQEKLNPAPIAYKKDNEILFEGAIPRVSMKQLIKWVEWKAKEAAVGDSPTVMNSWLVSLAGIDAAIRARRTRQIDRVKKDSVKVYLPIEDHTHPLDIEDAKIVPPPVEF